MSRLRSLSRSGRDNTLAAYFANLPWRRFLKIVSPVALFCIVFLWAPTFSQDRGDLEKQRKKLEKDITIIQQLLKETQANREASYHQLQTLRQKIRIREKVIGNINKEMEMIDEQIDETSAIITALEKDLVELKKEYSQMLVNMYKNRSSLNQLIFIFNAESFNDAFARIRYLQQFGEFRKKQAEVIEKTKQTLEHKRQEQATRKTDKQSLLSAEQGEKQKLNQEISQQDHLITSLKKKEKELLEELQKKKKAADDLNKRIIALIAKEAAKPVTADAIKLSATFASNQGRLPWPVEKGVICETFGEHPHPVLKKVKVVNNGVDICTNANSQVRALFSGTVVSVMYNPGIGFKRAVMIRHGEYYTIYTNLEEVFVGSGDEVTVKQPIGIVHTDEKSGETKVHLEVYKKEQKLNPALWMYPNNQ